MAKSSYLDNLINNKLPVNNNRYLSNLWADYGNNSYYTYFNSMINNFTNEQIVALTSDDYLNNLNTNQSVLDMSYYFIEKVTLDPRYLPVRTTSNIPGIIGNDLIGRGYNTILAPKDYLPATITSINPVGANLTIPILFPASFSRSISANFAKENPVGSDRPIMAYSYTDAEEIPFEFDALADYLPEGFSSLKSYVDAIISILKPRKSNNVIYEPTVRVTFADMSFEGVCTSVGISYDNVYGNKSFVHAKINCQFTRLG